MLTNLSPGITAGARDSGWPPGHTLVSLCAQGHRWLRHGKGLWRHHGLPRILGGLGALEGPRSPPCSGVL